MLLTVALAASVVAGCTTATPGCDPCAAPPTTRPPDPLTTTMTVDLLVGGELPPEDAQALLHGQSRACRAAPQRPGNVLGLDVGRVIHFTSITPPYGRHDAPVGTDATVTIETATTAFIYGGRHTPDALGRPSDTGCRFTGRGVIPNAGKWEVRLPNGSTFLQDGSHGGTDRLDGTYGQG